MRTSLIAAAAALMMSAAPAFADALVPQTYGGKFKDGKCGQIVVNADGVTGTYKYGKCTANGKRVARAEFTTKVKIRQLGPMVIVDAMAAKFRFTDVDADTLTGTFTFNGTEPVTFKA